MRSIALLDCNNFFVSCERLFRPDLKGKPVAVMSGNDGCIVARSQEVKDMGIPMGVPIFQVKDIIKDNGVTLFSSNFTLYRDVSRRVFAIVRSMVSQFEQYSIDEGFFYIDEVDVAERARVIKDTVERMVGIPVSIGVAPSKTLAKYAATRAKKASGVYVIPADAVSDEMASVGLGQLWGVGEGRVRAFAEHAFRNVADLVEADPARVSALYGIEGIRLQQEVSGQQALALNAHRSAKKSIMSSRSFAQSTHELPVVLDAVSYHLRRVVDGLKKSGLAAGSITVYMHSSRYESNGYGGQIHPSRLVVPTDSITTLMTLVHAVVIASFDPTIAYKKAGVMASDIVPLQSVPRSLFDTSDTAGRTVLDSVMAGINHKHGQDTVRVGSTGKGTLWHTRSDRCSSAYTTRWDEIRVVKA